MDSHHLCRTPSSDQAVDFYEGFWYFFIDRGQMSEQSQNEGGPGLSGTLLEEPFARVFYNLAREKKTGILNVYTNPPPAGKILKRIYMKGGRSFCVQGGSVKETLGAILVMQGKLKREEYDRLLNEVGGDHGRLEQNLIASSQSLGIAPHELGELLGLQTEIKIKLCFGWVKGYYMFHEVSDEEIEKDRVLYPLSPEKLLLEGVREQYPPDRVKVEFTGIERKLFRASDGLKDALSQFGLPPGTIRFLERLPSEIRFSSVIQQSKLKADAAQALFLALYFGGYLTLPREDENFPLGRAYEAAEPRAKAEKPAAPRPEKKEEPKKEAPREEPKLAIEERLDRKMSDEDIVKEIDQFLELIFKKDTTYFDIMGVDRSVAPSKIKKIYFKMAKVFHPDSHPDLFKGELRDRVETLFTKISEAYDVLTDTQKREAYIKQTTSKVSAEEMEKANRAVTAELEFQKAEVLLKRGAFAKAREILDQVVKLMPDEQEYRIYQAWAMYKTEGPGKAQAARQIIEKALKGREKNKDGYFYLGMINRAEGHTEDAIKYFQKVLELDSYNIEAQRELRVLTMRKDKAAEKGGRFGRRR